MTLLDFLQLNLQGRIEATEKAVCIRGRKENDFFVLLFQLNSFYIEVFYHHILRTVCGVFGFDDVAELDPYLDEIQLPLYN